MATSPDVIRRTLLRLTGLARRELRAVSEATKRDAQAWRAALFASVPLIVGEYGPASATLGADWFTDLREDSTRRLTPFTPSIVVPTSAEDMTAMVARNTSPLLDPMLDVEAEIERIIAQIEAEVQREIAQAFRETVTENSKADPESVGWQRFTRDGGCKFCLMLAARGAVYVEANARFASHTNCNCLAGPSYDPDAPKADVLQYVASRRSRTPAQQARVRAYLNSNFPDAPG